MTNLCHIENRSCLFFSWHHILRLSTTTSTAQHVIHPTNVTTEQAILPYMVIFRYLRAEEKHYKNYGFDWVLRTTGPGRNGTSPPPLVRFFDHNIWTPNESNDQRHIETWIRIQYPSAASQSIVDISTVFIHLYFVHWEHCLGYLVGLRVKQVEEFRHSTRILMENHENS